MSVENSPSQPLLLQPALKRAAVHWRGVSLAAVLLMGLSACVTTTGTPELLAGVRPSTIPPTVDTVGRNDDLRRLSQGQHQGILNTYGGAYSDAKLELSVARIVGKLVAASPNPDVPYTITLLNSPQINAFALPGGYLYITRGLLALANNGAELAAVIAHEMAHVLANHGVERARLEAREALASRVISEIWTDAAEVERTKLRGKLRLAQFSREQELQADQIGIELMAKAGFDPHAAVRFQRAMAAYANFRSAAGDNDASLDFLATHPSAPQRQALAEQAASRIGPPGTGTLDRDAYLAGLEGVLYGDSAEDGFVRGASFIHPVLGIAFSVPQGFRVENTAAAVLATGPGDIAVRFDGAKLAATTPLTTYLASGWVGGLDPASIRAYNLNGLDAASARANARGWSFDITVIRVGDGVYRILTAAPTGAEPEPTAAIVRNSFRALTAAERASATPLRIRVVTVKAGETPAMIAARMRDVDRPLELLRLLNGLSAGAALSAGQSVKIVTAQ
jgi:predicted Zn-dependent protease